MEARVARLEAAVEHIQTDVRDIKAALTQLVPVVNRMDGFLQATLPTLATKLEMERRPTRRQAVLDLAMIASLVGAVLTIASRLAH